MPESHIGSTLHTFSNEKRLRVRVGPVVIDSPIEAGRGTMKRKKPLYSSRIDQRPCSFMDSPMFVGVST